MNDLKIEAGKEYRMRDGRRARVYAIDGGGAYPVHGARFYPGGKSEVLAWSVQGLHDLYEGNSSLDLIAPWTEPKPKLKAWILRRLKHNYAEIVFLPEGEPPCPYGSETLYTRAPKFDDLLPEDA